MDGAGATNVPCILPLTPPTNTHTTTTTLQKAPPMDKANLLFTTDQPDSLVANIGEACSL